MGTIHSTVAPAARLHGLDALRGGALLLGVVLHCTMSFLPWSQLFWITADHDPSRTLSVVFWLIHLFRMTVFFLLAGFFGRLLCERLGTRAFIGDRARRIGLVLLLAWPLLFAAIVAAARLAQWIAYGEQSPPFAPPTPKFTADDFPLAHLWFLYVLLWFYVAMLVLRWLLARLDRSAVLNAIADRVLSWVLWPWAALLLALPLAFALYHQPSWYLWFGIPTPDHSLYPNRPALVGYGMAFLTGWLLHRQPLLLQRLARHWPLHVLLAICTALYCLRLIGISPYLLPATLHSSTSLVYALAYSMGMWAATLGLVGLSVRVCIGFSAWRRYLVDASYWVYLLHLPLVMALQAALSPLAWPWWLKFPLLLASALGLLLLSYHWLVRGRWLERTLFGGRSPATRDG
jgi:peptidoglycan/LPS O-acetylase OafA/YrhL